MSTPNFSPLDAAHPTAAIAEPIAAASSQFGSAIRATDPLVVDVSSGHTGITLTEFNAATTTTFFDMASNGFAQQTAWTTGDTGFLVRDLNSNGVIDNAGEMFGNNSADGFAQLAALDSNHDLKIDSHDSAWGSLQVWIDANGNGVTDSGELHSLSSLGIASIDLAGVAPPTSYNYIDTNPVSHVSTITFTDGSTADIADVWLTGATANTYYTSDYTLDPDTIFMPDLRGYGSIADLATAMSQDSTLKGMVADYVSAFQTDGFAMTTLESDFSSILYRWAGVDSVDPHSRGAYIDARQLDFMEHLLGQDFYQVHNPSDTDPMAYPAQYIEQSWHTVFTDFLDSFLLQAGGSSLFANPVSYNPVTGTSSGDTALSHDGIDALAANAPSGADANVAYWLEIGHFVDTIKGLDNVTTTEDSWLNDAVYSTNPDLSWDTISSMIGGTIAPNTIASSTDYDTVTGTDAADAIYIYGNNETVHAGIGNDVIYGYGAHNSLYGDAGNDTIYGGDGGNSLYGGDGNDTLYGGSGNDVLDGGSGGNMLFGYGGDDTYVYHGGDDFINENDGGGNDQIVMPSGVTLSDLSFALVETDSSGNYTDLLITIAGQGTIQIDRQFDAIDTGYHVEKIVFSDSSTLDLSTINPSDAYMANDGATFYTASSDAVTVHGGSGADTISASSSTANNTFDGGAGNDTITGGSGNDTYIASPGFDSIPEDAGGTDTIVIPAAYSLSDLTFVHPAGSNYDLIIDIAGLGEIDIGSQFYGTGTFAIENLHFLSDDSTVAIADQTVQVFGTAGNDSLYGPTFGVAGSIIDGRGGTDYIYGGAGDNTFVFGPGFGSSTVGEISTAGSNTVHFTGIDPSDIRMWTDYSGNLHLQDIADTSHNITIYAGTTGGGYTSESAIDQYLAQITFDDTAHTVWTIADGLHITGDDSGDYLYGTAHDDTLTGGSGNDHFYGNGGSDTYVFAAGWGSDTINESSNTDTNTIHFTGVDPADIRMYTDSSGNLHLVDIGDASNNITVYAGLTYAIGTTEESAIGSYIQQVTFDDSGHTTWDLTAGLNIQGDDSGDSLYGTASGDTITGGAGNDYLYGNGGDDTLVSNGGSDYLYGGSGSDTYVFASGFGNSAIFETTNTDTNTIHFTGIDPSDIRMWTDYSGNLHLQDTGDPSHSITVYAGQTYASGTTDESAIGSYVQQVTFDDVSHTTWDLTGGLTMSLDDSGGGLYGTAGGDTLTAGNGSSYNNLYGNGGDDTLVAGTGTSYLYGGTGSDTYVFASGFGNSTISETANTDTNTIHFTGIDPSDIRMWTDSYGALHLQDITDTSHSITVYAGTAGSGTDESTIGSYVQQVTFDDVGHTTWDLTGGLNLRVDSGSDNLYGSAYNDTLTVDGSASYNNLYGNDGNDTLVAGSGTSYLYGGAGSDTYVFASGFGNSTISESANTDTNTIHFTGIDPSDIRMWTDYSGTLHLQDITDTSHSISVNAGTTGSGMYESTIGSYVQQVTFDDAGNSTWDLTSGLQLTADNSGDYLYGTSGDDTITGGIGNDYLYGNGGNDVLYGGGGSNTLDGGTGTNTVDYSQASAGVTVDLSSGTASDNGEGGSDTLYNIQNVNGSTHDDTITGNSSDNVISGGSGSDTLTGGSGADTFVFKAGETGSDTITDFSTSDGDKIDVHSILTTYDPLTSAVTDFVHFTASGSDVIVSVDANGTAGGANFVQIATLTGGASLAGHEADLLANGNLIAHV